MLKLERSRNNAANLWLTLPKDDDDGDALKQKVRQFLTQRDWRL